MLRIYFMQQWLGYSNPAMEDELHDHAALRCFAACSLEMFPMRPLLQVQTFLERHDLCEKLVVLTWKILLAKG